MEGEDTNTKLHKIIFELLKDKRIPKDDREILQNLFIDSYYEVLKISFDVSLDPEKLYLYITKNDIKNKLTNALFISKTIDNPKTYDYINYFCYNFIRIINEKYF